MRTVTLRKAARIRSKLDELFTEAVKEIGKNTTLTVNLSDDDINDQLVRAGTTVVSNVEKLKDISLTRQVIRSAIARSNASSGVSDTLAQIARNTGLIETLEQVSGGRRYGVTLEPRPDAAKVDARVKMKRDVLLSEARGGQESVAFGTLAQADLDAIELTIKALNTENETLRDSVEALNATITIALDDAVEAKLLSYEIAL